MSRDYSNLGLDANLRSLSGPVASERLDPYEIDSQYGISPGAIDYSRITSPGRTYRAIVSTSTRGGAFTSIQNAIDYVNNLGGGAVLITTGTYTISSNINIYSNIYLYGEDADTSVVNLGSQDIGIRAIGTTNGTLSNILVSKVGVINGSSTVNNGAVMIQYCTDMTIEECRFASLGTTSVKDIHVVNNSQRIYISKNRFINGATMLRLGSADDVFFNDNFISNSRSNVIENSTGRGQRLTVRNNNIVNSGTVADAIFFLEGAPTESVIEGNHIVGGVGNGIDIVGAVSGIVIANNVVHRGSALGGLGGIFLDTSCTGCLISGNNILQATAGTNDGIRLVNSSYNTIVGNVSGSNSGYGISITGGTASSTNVVVGNIFRGNTVGQINDSGTLTVVANNGTA